MELTKTDLVALSNQDSEYLLIKGNNLELKKKYDDALKYYELAAVMGDIQAISEIGNYYVDYNKNISLAKAYLFMAANQNNVSALYKLGYIYKYEDKDKELSNYYFSKALKSIINNDEEKGMYPSLFYELGLDFLDREENLHNLYEAYDSLMTAKLGFIDAIESGIDSFEEKLKRVNELLSDEKFLEVKEIYEEMQEDDCDCDCDCDCGCGDECNCKENA